MNTVNPSWEQLTETDRLNHTGIGTRHEDQEVSRTNMETVTAPATMLLIEDDPAIRRLIQAGLGEAAVRIVEASTASEGIELAARRKPDVILLDLGLPDGEGMNVLKA